jgi:hypothetical protein
MTDVFGLWLQSLDPLKVASESFHTAEHRAMVKAHEERKRKALEFVFQPRTLAEMYTPAKAREKRVQRIAYEHEFTDRQLEIARRVLDVE